jgi:hypothetical protein
MSSRSFRSVFMVSSCAGAALSCYLVSLRVASERAALENVEAKIVVAQRDMRVLQTEIGPRGRLSQLERWNAGAFALSAPQADQFVKGSFELAQLARPDRKVDFQAPVVLASAPAPRPQKPLAEPATDDGGAPAASAVSPRSLLHQASLKTETREDLARPAAVLPPAAARTTDKPAIAAKPAKGPSVAKPGLAAAQPSKKAAGKIPPKKSVDKPTVTAAKAVTKPVRIAKLDPLAPLPAKRSGNSRGSATER